MLKQLVTSAWNAAFAGCLAGLTGTTDFLNQSITYWKLRMGNNLVYTKLFINKDISLCMQINYKMKVRVKLHNTEKGIWRSMNTSCHN